MKDSQTYSTFRSTWSSITFPQRVSPPLDVDDDVLILLRAHPAAREWVLLASQRVRSQRLELLLLGSHSASELPFTSQDLPPRQSCLRSSQHAKTSHMCIHL